MRVLLVGAGRAGANHAAHLTQIAGVFDSDAEAARTLAERHGTMAFPSLEAGLEAADAVVISTPTFTHCELAVAAARAGRHVLCEKPMALDERECEAMIAAAREAGVVLQIGFMRRFQRRIGGRPVSLRQRASGLGVAVEDAGDVRQVRRMVGARAARAHEQDPHGLTAARRPRRSGSRRS